MNSHCFSYSNGHFLFLTRLLEYEAETGSRFTDLMLKEALVLTDSKSGYLYLYDSENDKLALHSSSGCEKGDLHVLKEQVVTELVNSEKYKGSFLNNRVEIINEFGIKQNFSDKAGIQTLLPDRMFFIPVFRDKKPDGAVVLTNRICDYSQEEAESTRSIIGIAWKLFSVYRQLDELKIQKLKAEQNELLKNNFMVNVAHEIKTPVNAIVGFSNLLTEPGITNEARKKFLDIILNSSDELLTITSDFSEISNLENNLSISGKQVINLAILLTELGDYFAPKARGKNLKFLLKIQLEENDHVVFTDPAKLKRIISSIAGNAVKFTYNGHIELLCRRKNGNLEFIVSDTGIGMSATARQKVSSILSQGDQMLGKKPDGRGIGLALAYAYIRHLGGDIWFTSTEGEGSVFSFTLPFEKNPDIKNAEQAELHKEASVKDSKKVVLVAEDDDNNYPLIENIFLKQNLKVLRAVNGKEAVRICKSQHVDIVFMDIKMPEMDGYTAARLILESGPDTKIIAQTAYFGDRDKALSQGCIDFIAKPFSKQQLVSLINKYL